MALIANIILAALALAMGAILLRQYTQKPRPHTLWYAVGLVLLAAAAGPEVYAGVVGGAVPTLLWWLYWVCASSTVGFLAVGTAYLISPKVGKAALISAAGLTLLLLIATVLTAGEGPTTAAVFERAPTWQIKVPFLIQNILGSLVIFGGASWSYVRTRGLYNIWIALGTLMFASGGAASGLAEISDLFYFTQVAGIVLLFLGVYQSTRFRAARAGATA